ncbi:hypothetical protein A3K63_01080 [Candidatus Micrarchaeota archaeon RBG_16_49_10]|nr:MAG: hypothetical protein A3K63_01080 [Candidatus Micrarchaeota archaeon RBG_16_49_10]
MVSLPLSWSRRFEIDKKRELSLQETEDGILSIIPGDMKNVKDETSISITKTTTSDKIYYRILRAYLSGYSRITLFGELNDEQMDFLDIIHKRIVGLEVTEQQEDRIVLTDLLKPEDVSLDKIVNQMFSFITVMVKDIISDIEQGIKPGDKILDRDSITVRNHNLAYRCCNMALKDSVYLGRLRKKTNEILVLSRIVRSLDMIGTILIGISYLINDEMTAGMRKHHYKILEKDEETTKILLDYLKKWLLYFQDTKMVLRERNIEKATNLYIKRFDYKIKVAKGTRKPEYLSHITDFCNQLNMMTALILRDFIMY